MHVSPTSTTMCPHVTALFRHRLRSHLVPQPADVPPAFPKATKCVKPKNVYPKGSLPHHSFPLPNTCEQKPTDSRPARFAFRKHDT